MFVESDLTILVPPPRQTLQERVYDSLRTALMRGQFPPGRSLTIRSLAIAMHTSSMPVREALRQLVTEGAVELLPNRSFTVPRLSRQRYEDLLRVRCEIEGYATAEAATRIGIETVARLNEINKSMAAAEEEGDRNRYVSCNQEFHFTIYKASDSQILLPLIEALWLQIGPYLGYVFRDGLRPVAGLQCHEALIDALRRRNATEAREIMVRDIREPAEIIRSLADSDLPE